MSENMEVMLKTEIVPSLNKAKYFIVKCDNDRENAVMFTKTLKELKASVEEKLHPTANKKKAYESYKAALDTENALYNPIDDSIAIVIKKIKSYDTAEALKAQELAAKAEAARLEKERIEREKLLEKAKSMEEKGKIEKAEMLKEQADSVNIAPDFNINLKQTKDLVWKADVTNMFQLCKSIAEGKVPFNVVEVKQSALNNFAKTYDGKSEIAGLSFYQQTQRI